MRFGGRSYGWHPRYLFKTLKSRHIALHARAQNTLFIASMSLARSSIYLPWNAFRLTVQECARPNIILEHFEMTLRLYSFLFHRDIVSLVEWVSIPLSEEENGTGHSFLEALGPQQGPSGLAGRSPLRGCPAFRSILCPLESQPAKTPISPRCCKLLGHIPTAVDLPTVLLPHAAHNLARDLAFHLAHNLASTLC